uniref:Translationally-controlled tumor protein n=1 Tax=Phascolarctos cinereus TaxID=38626 RepID=A0A6P5K8B4_PHACI|nr:translationally-controlled tumor protein homolog isoform X1 [Phascolarctos cinereus]
MAAKSGKLKAEPGREGRLASLSCSPKWIFQEKLTNGRRRNASAEGPEGEGTDGTVITGVDMVINHHLQVPSFTKESYKKYIKDYLKSIKVILEEHNPDSAKLFMTGAAEQIKHILANLKKDQFFTGENMKPDGMVAVLDFHENGVTPYMILFKDGLETEKC